MIKIKTSVLWSIINDKEHKSLKEKDKTIEALMPLVSALFPGINYYSITGFSQVMQKCVIPVLRKRYPELLTVAEGKISPKAMTEVTEALPSKGYEWQESTRWRSEFRKILLAISD